MKIYNTIIAIDPGISGGIVVWSNLKKSIYCANMPVHKVKKKNETNVAEISRIIRENQADPRVNLLIIIEQVNLRPSDQDTPGKIFRMQKLMANYDSLKSVFKVHEVDFVEVVPHYWQKQLNLGKDKNQNKEYTQKMYPQVKFNLKTGDAGCILIFCRLKLKNDPNWVKEKLKNLPYYNKTTLL